MALRRRSHPSRDVWIEIFQPAKQAAGLLSSHPSRDVWIEMTYPFSSSDAATSHIPHGMCGLKFFMCRYHVYEILSHPSRDVWIEIRHRHSRLLEPNVSHPSRDVWIEISSPL